MADPIPPFPPPAGPPTDDGLDRIGLEHLGWTPTWRDRLEALRHRTTPARLAGAVAGAVALVVVAGAVALRGPAPPAPELTLPMVGSEADPSAATTTTIPVPEAVEVVVHAAGAVARPGVYRLPAGARVADLLGAAGGTTAEADLDRVNLAAPLADGARVFVPRPDQVVPPVEGFAAAAGAPGAGGAPPVPSEPVDLNTATAAELDALPGVGPATAEAILAERDRRGGFASVDDLLDVRGIGEAKLADLRPRVRV